MAYVVGVGGREGRTGKEERWVLVMGADGEGERGGLGRGGTTATGRGDRVIKGGTGW